MLDPREVSPCTGPISLGSWRQDPLALDPDAGLIILDQAGLQDQKHLGLDN